MFNWIGLYAVNTILYGGGTGVMYDAKTTKTWSLRNVYPDAVIPDMGLARLQEPLHHHRHLPGHRGGHPGLCGGEQDHLRL